MALENNYIRYHIYRHKVCQLPYLRLSTYYMYYVTQYTNFIYGSALQFKRTIRFCNV